MGDGGSLRRWRWCSLLGGDLRVVPGGFGGYVRGSQCGFDYSILYRRRGGLRVLGGGMRPCFLNPPDLELCVLWERGSGALFGGGGDRVKEDAFAGKRIEVPEGPLVRT